MSTLFDTVILTPTTVSGTTYPMLTMIPIHKPSIIYPDDFFLLEKYEVSRDNEALMLAARSAANEQSVLYYMDEGGSKCFMSASLHMGEYDLGEPEWIDITSYFSAGLDTITDTNTDVENYMYVYRIIYLNNQSEFASEYLLGVEDVSFSEIFEGADLPDELTTVNLSYGNGTLYRLSRDGTIVMKGFPVPSFNHRYRGPIESSKYNANITSQDRGLDLIELKSNAVESFLDEAISNLISIGESAADTSRRQA